MRFVVARDTGCDETGTGQDVLEGCVGDPATLVPAEKAVCWRGRQCVVEKKEEPWRGTVRMLHGTMMFLLGEKSLDRNRP